MTITDICIIIENVTRILQNAVILAVVIIIQISVFVKRKNEKRGDRMDTYLKIKQLCDERGVSISALAAGIGVRSSVFSELKMGRTKQLSVTTINKIAEYFDVPPSFFLEETGEPEDIREELFRKRKLLFDLSGKASSEDLDKIIKIVDALVADG